MAHSDNTFVFFFYIAVSLHEPIPVSMPTPGDWTIAAEKD
jgi:hypothetical protein